MFCLLSDYFWKSRGDPFTWTSGRWWGSTPFYSTHTTLEITLGDTPSLISLRRTPKTTSPSPHSHGPQGGRGLSSQWPPLCADAGGMVLSVEVAKCWGTYKCLRRAGWTTQQIDAGTRGAGREEKAQKWELVSLKGATFGTRAINDHDILPILQ